MQRGMQGRIQKIQKGLPGYLSAILDTFYVSEHFIKIIQNLKEKGVTAVPSASP